MIQVGSWVRILPHPSAKAWHRARVGQTTQVLEVNVMRTSYGQYHRVCGGETPIAAICLQEIKPDAAFERFLKQVTLSDQHDPTRRGNSPQLTK